MKRRNSKCTRETLIPVDDAIYTLRISRHLFHTWRDQGRFDVRINTSGKQCISQKDLKKLAYTEDARKGALDAFKAGAVRCQTDKLTRMDAIFLTQNSKKIQKYKSYIKTVEAIHASYHDSLDILNTESPLVAAYALYAKVINLLYMTCLCLDKAFWYSGVLLRIIDETIDLAIYFIIRGKTNQGKKHLEE